MVRKQEVIQEMELQKEYIEGIIEELCESVKPLLEFEGERKVVSDPVPGKVSFQVRSMSHVDLVLLVKEVCPAQHHVWDQKFIS